MASYRLVYIIYHQNLLWNADPFIPRPEVLPYPEPVPRPTRFLPFVEPSFGFKSFNFILLPAQFLQGDLFLTTFP